MLRELFKSDYVHSSDFVFAQDVPVTQRPLSLDEFQERREKAEAFLHKVGPPFLFLSLALTCWVGR